MGKVRSPGVSYSRHFIIVEEITLRGREFSRPISTLLKKKGNKKGFYYIAESGDVTSGQATLTAEKAAAT